MTIAVELRHRLGDFRLDVAFEIAESGVTALFGPSGAGKTTTIDAIAGLLRPDEGRVLVKGRILLDTSAGIDLPPRARRVGYVFQDGRLFPHLSVRRNLLFGWRRAERRASRSEIDELVRTLGIEQLLERRVQALSGGEAQRVALGRALLMHPQVLLMDEPLAGLDPARKADILPYIERLHDQARVPIVYVSHNIAEVARLADHIVVINGGRVAASGTVFDITTRLDLPTLTPQLEAGAVLRGTIRSHHPSDGLTELGLSAGEFLVPLIDRAVGQKVRIRVAARDVMLSLREPRDISANNIIRATVREIGADPGPFVDVLLSFGRDRLVARITRRSVERLRLAPGCEVYALIKSVTVDRPSRAAAPP